MKIKKPKPTTVVLTCAAVGAVGGYLVAGKMLQFKTINTQRLSEAVYIISVIERNHPGAMDEALAIIRQEMQDAGGELIIPAMEAVA